MKKIIKFTVIILAAFIALSASISHARELDQMPSSVKTPEALAEWLASEFKYRLEFPDKWQSPDETILSKQGDCEDFAVLTSACLNRMGIANNILIVKFKNLGTSHAVCAWKDDAGSYNFISNRSLKQTHKKTLEAAIEKYYPDWGRITFTDEYNNRIRTLSRKS